MFSIPVNKIEPEVVTALFIGGPVDGELRALSSLDRNKQALYLISTEVEGEYLRPYPHTYTRLEYVESDREPVRTLRIFIYTGEIRS